MEERRTALSAYLMDISRRSVPTEEEEVEAFRALISVEAMMAGELASVRSFRIGLLDAFEKEGVPPPSPSDWSPVPPSAIRLARYSDSGREWMQDSVSHTQKCRDEDEAFRIRRRISSLDAKQRALKGGFASRNLRLVVATAKTSLRECKHMGLEDLIQEGSLGLLKAIDRFDPEKGCRFGTYAVWWIRHSVRRAVSDKDAQVRIPSHAKDLSRRLRRIESVHMTEFGRHMTVEEMVERTEAPKRTVETALMARIGTISLDAPVSEEGEYTFLDNIPSETEDPVDSMAMEAFREKVLQMVQRLPSFEAMVIRSRFGIDGDVRTLQEVAEDYGLSRERIRQVEVNALRTLKSRMKSASFDDYAPGH